MEKKFTVVRYFAYSLEILVLFVLQGTPQFLPEIFGGKPVFLIPLAIIIACLEKELPAMFFSLGCGVLLDIGFSNNIGFYAILITVICFFVSVIFRDYMVVSFLNTMAFAGVGIVVVMLLHFFVFYVLKGYDHGGYYFVHHYISRIIYTFVFVTPFYFLNKGLFKNLRDF